MDADALAVLLVDSDTDRAETARRRLERDQRVPLSVRSETTVSGALDRLEDPGVDCVVSERRFADGTGLELLERVREDHPNLPFVLCTGDGSEEVAAKAIQSGVSSYLRRDPRSDADARLAETVREHAEAYRARRRDERIGDDYRRIADVATDAFWAVDPSTEEITMAGLGNFGYEEYDPGREWWAERLHPEDRDRVLDHDEAALAGDPSAFDEVTESHGRFSIEYRWRRADGEYASCSERGVVVFEDGEPARMVGTMTDVTERRERERELERARDRTEFALETTDAVVWDVDLETGETTYYPSSQTLYDVDIGTVDDFLSRVHPDDRGRVREAIERAEETGSYRIEFRIRTDDGVRWVADEGRIEFDDGTPVRATGVGRDVTERVERERELERSERRFEAVFDDPEMLIGMLDTDGTLRQANETATALVDAGHDSLTGEPFPETPWWTHSEALQADLREWIDRAADGEYVEFEADHRRASGETMNVDGTVRPVTDDAGDVVSLIVSARDVTDRERQRERFQSFLEYSNDIVTVLEPDGTLEYQNPSSERLLGYEPAELVGENIFEYVHPNDREAVMETFQDAIEDPDATPTAEYRFRHADGSVRWLESIGNNQLSNPAVEGFVVNSRDVTDRKEFERELRRKNDRLEEFASIVSHDLRNPLNTVMGRLTLVQEHCESEHFEAVDRALDRMERIVEDTLTLAREGRTVGDREVVNLASLAEECWKRAETTEATLQTDGPLRVDGDPDRIAHVLENLFGNALTHGGEDVTVRVGPTDDGEGFYVEDTGRGIPEERRDTVFETGYTTADEGTGFGLNIVREIVDAHGWDLALTESADGGARFEVTGVDVPHSDRAG